MGTRYQAGARSVIDRAPGVRLAELSYGVPDPAALGVASQNGGSAGSC